MHAVPCEVPGFPARPGRGDDRKAARPGRKPLGGRLLANTRLANERPSDAPMRKAPRKYSSFNPGPAANPAHPGPAGSAGRIGRNPTRLAGAARGESTRRVRAAPRAARPRYRSGPAQLRDLPGVVHRVMHQAVQGEVLGEPGAGRPVAAIEHRLLEHRRSGLPDGRGQVGAARRTGRGDRDPTTRSSVSRTGGQSPASGSPASAPPSRAWTSSAQPVMCSTSSQIEWPPGTGFRIASPAVTSLSSVATLGPCHGSPVSHAIQEVGEAVDFGHDVQG